MRLSDIISVAKVNNRVDNDDHYDHVIHSISLVKDRLRSSRQFMISDQTRNSMMKLGLASIEKNFDLVKLPFPECWFEMPAAVNEDPHGKAGAYAYQDEDGIHLMVVTYAKVYYQGQEAYNLWALKDFCTIRLEHGQIAIYHDTHGEESATRTMSVILCVVLNLVLFINTPGTLISTPHDMSKVNKYRVGKGKPSLSDYIELRLTKNVYQSLASSQVTGEKKLHWRRGHFKRKKNGLFWWNPHLVGDEVNGIRNKDYRV